MHGTIMTGEFSFPSPYWDNVSEMAKDLVKRLLLVDPEKRITAKNALSHPWIVTTLSSSSSVNEMPLSPQYASMFKKFNSKRKPTA